VQFFCNAQYYIIVLNKLQALLQKKIKFFYFSKNPILLSKKAIVAIKPHIKMEKPVDLFDGFQPF